ncbi:hypothetical protein FGG08_006734 [Glutinoglossum americanum]|uniref:PH domain-containing protein n=1 Tax=Glutinoglossum americanum TaxID=1670608 RepID=A0A9P8HS26_9PEZI|nr:hypothetical protein FGG08_006734 [Glutinoglossum americanum]
MPRLSTEICKWLYLVILDTAPSPQQPHQPHPFKNPEVRPRSYPVHIYIVSLLIERLQAWKHACGYLEAYVAATEKVQKTHSKEYEKVLKSVSEPLKEGSHFNQSLGGIAGLFESIRHNTQGIASSHQETEKGLKSSVLPVLERLHAEIKSKSKELSNGAAKGAKAVEKARSNTLKHVELLGQHTASFDSIGGRPDPNNDPYILQRGVYYRLDKQVLEENATRQDILAVQGSFQQFEAHIVDVIQQALGVFVQLINAQAERTNAMYKDMLGTAQRIPGDFEWKSFITHHNHALIDPNAPPRSMSNISFPNQSHRATKPLIEGTLERRSRLLKSYNLGYYVITPSKFLHEFKDNDHIRHDPSPELSLYLPDCIVGALVGVKFNVKGKDLSGGKVTGAFSTTHDMAFKLSTPRDAEKWHEIIKQCSGQVTNETPISPVSGPNSPVVQETKPQPPPAYAPESPPSATSPKITETGTANKEEAVSPVAASPTAADGKMELAPSPAPAVTGATITPPTPAAEKS